MDIIDKTTSFVKSALEGAEGGHDWWHIHRVLVNTRIIGEKEKADMLICQLGALLHDIADPKFHDGDEKKGSLLAKEFLGKENISSSQIDAVVHIIENISFAGGKITRNKSLELMIVQDADRLDAMGAIGIARAFNYGGYKNRPLYDPSIPPRKYAGTSEYRNSKAPTLNHFHEKLLMLKDMMNTATGKEMARERHDFMLLYLDKFLREWGETN